MLGACPTTSRREATLTAEIGLGIGLGSEHGHAHLSGNGPLYRVGNGEGDLLAALEGRTQRHLVVQGLTPAALYVPGKGDEDLFGFDATQGLSEGVAVVGRPYRDRLHGAEYATTLRFAKITRGTAGTPDCATNRASFSLGGHRQASDWGTAAAPRVRTTLPGGRRGKHYPGG